MRRFGRNPTAAGSAASALAGDQAPGGSAHLDLIRLQKRYGRVDAVRDVSLSIGKGEFVTLLGASGSGKTTTLLMTAGFERPTAGEIRMDGRVVTALPAHRRGIGIVFQNYALFPHMTVAENVGYPLRRRRVGADARRTRVEAALDLVNLAGLEARYPRQLSGGQQQRVALARALIFDPPVLLMDEPMGALDKNLRAQLQDEIARLHRDLAVTVVYVTHDQEEALTLSDRIVVMNHGGIEQVGTPTDVYSRPRTLFVAEFVGDSNAFAGVVKDVSLDVVTVQLDGGEIVEAIAPVGDTGAMRGQRVKVVVRPEKLRFVGLEPTDAERSADDRGLNRVTILVTRVSFLGKTLRWQARTATGLEITLSQPVPDRGGQAVQVGDAAQVGWETGAGIALPTDVEPIESQSDGAELDAL